MKQFDEFWESWKYDPASIDEAFEECFKAGMLAAADIAKACYSGYEAHSIEWAIREEAKE